MKMEPVKPWADWTWADVAPILKLAAWGLAAILATFGGASGVSEVEQVRLSSIEKQAGTTEAWALHRRDIEAAMVARAKCDSALESFSRHRDDPRDWAHVLEECHTEGGINP